MRSRTISVSVAAPPAEVYAFAAEPANLGRWAAGLDPSLPVQIAPRESRG